MALSETREVSVPTVRETRSSLERRVVPVDMDTAYWLDRTFLSDRPDAVQDAITTHGQTANKLLGKNSSHRDYDFLASQWRGAALLYLSYRDENLPEDADPVLDALVYVFSAMQNYKGAAVINGGPFIRDQKTRGRSINPITDEAPWNPNHELSRGGWKQVKPRQSIVPVGDQEGILRAVKGAEKIPEAVMRALTLLSVAAEEDPGLLTHAFNWFKLRVAHIPNGIAPALGVLEIATRLGQQDNPAFAPLMKFLPWYVREHNENSDSVIGRYKYVSNQPNTGLLYRKDAKPTLPLLPDAKRIRDLGVRLEAMEGRMRQLRGSHNLVLASIGVKDLSQFGRLRDQIAAAKSEQRRLVTQYFAQWNGLVDGVARSVRVPEIVINGAPNKDDIEEIEEILDELFGGTSFVPSKADPENETYSAHVTTTRWADHNPLVRLRYLMENPTFEVAMKTHIKEHPDAIFELMKQTYAAMLREKYLVRSDKVDRFLRLTTREAVDGFDHILWRLADGYPGHYLGTKIQERRELITARYRQIVEGQILSRSLNMEAIRRSWNYTDAKKAYARNYRRDLMYLTLIATTMLIAWNADTYLALMKKADELSQKWGLSLDARTWNIPQRVKDWTQGKRQDGEEQAAAPTGSTQPTGEEGGSASQNTKQREVLFEPPDPYNRGDEANQEKNENAYIRYAKVVQQPDAPVNTFYVALPPTEPQQYERAATDKIQRVNFLFGLEYPDDTLVLETTHTRYFYAPRGWEILSVFTTSDVQAVQTAEGSIEFLADPGRVHVVYSRLPGGGYGFQAETVAPYDRFVDRDAFFLLNAQLAADPSLQKIHSSFLADLDAAQTNAEESDVIIRYVDMLDTYITVTRTYSSTTPSLNQQVDGLAWVAQNASLGFECEVSHRMADEFFRSAGVIIQQNAGEDTTRYGSALWGEGPVHVNTRIILPDGRIFIADFQPQQGMSPADGAPMSEEDGPGFFSIYRDEIRNLAVGTGLTALAAAAVISIARGRGRRRRDRRMITKQIVKSLKYGAPVEELPAMDASETELVLAMAHRITSLPEEAGTRQEIDRIINALSRYRPKVGAQGRAAFIVDVAANDHTAVSFIASSPRSVMRRLSEEYGSRAIHASAPAAITEEIGQYTGSTPAVSQLFADYAGLVKAMWETMSGFGELRASVIASLTPEEKHPNERIARARERIEHIFRETTMTSENKYALSMLWAMDAVLKVTTPQDKKKQQ